MKWPMFVCDQTRLCYIDRVKCADCLVSQLSYRAHTHTHTQLKFKMQRDWIEFRRRHITQKKIINHFSFFHLSIRWFLILMTNNSLTFISSYIICRRNNLNLFVYDYHFSTCSSFSIYWTHACMLNFSVWQKLKKRQDMNQF